jgi:glycerol-3-phosphate O-acyltransferase
MNFIEKVDDYKKNGQIPAKLCQSLIKFYVSYSLAVKQNGHNISEYEAVLQQFLEIVMKQLTSPFVFEPYHPCLREPIDYYQLGLDLLRPLIIFESSTVSGLQNLDLIDAHLQKNDNVIFFANHQTEPDPQAISLLLEASYPKLAEEMIFVAGHRVITDPLAVPLSMGRNLLCIFSKKYIEQDSAEQKLERLQHNTSTMKRMSQLLAEGGKCIYMAPSGGRDRPGASGVVEVAPFDPQSIEMFWLMAQQSGHPTHFYPLALATYDLLPPPHSIRKEIGEGRHTKCTPIHLAFGPEIDMIHYPGSDAKDKRTKRKHRAEYIWSLVKNEYERMSSQSFIPIKE